jgi:hypothetical protein
MPWSNRVAYPFNETSIIANAPQGAGVYALYNKTTWVYVGESSNILGQLIQHLRGDVPCISMFPHLNFSYETINVPVARAWRMKDVINEFRPICNPRFS